MSTTLLQQNAHAVIPFVVSSRGYGFLWNNPAVGRAEFARNVTRWTAEATNCLDYWITAGDTPAEITRAFKLGFAWLAATVTIGDGCRAIGRTAHDLIVTHLPGKTIVETYDGHAKMQQVGDD